MVSQSSVTDAALSPSPNQRAFLGGMAALLSGRCEVRRISASMSRSTKQLRELAAPAASVPPTRVAANSSTEGRPRAANIMTGTVVTSRSSMMRGLVSAT